MSIAPMRAPVANEGVVERGEAHESVLSLVGGFGFRFHPLSVVATNHDEVFENPRTADAILLAQAYELSNSSGFVLSK